MIRLPPPLEAGMMIGALLASLGQWLDLPPWSILSGIFLGIVLSTLTQRKPNEP